MIEGIFEKLKAVNSERYLASTPHSFDGSASISASTANPVAASAMRRPLSDVGSLSLLSEEAGQRPLVGSWFCTNQARARLRFP